MPFPAFLFSACPRGYRRIGALMSGASPCTRIYLRGEFPVSHAAGKSSHGSAFRGNVTGPRSEGVAGKKEKQTPKLACGVRSKCSVKCCGWRLRGLLN
ncbi:hypothetical protein VZT92_004640 [Zoarces viviparus]|uniref:Uncharacterized protein n=1 Tax=Zoarces viviparus TaxID=48416 RepID=A0AAW1FWZ8_ZOAVI